MTTVAGKTHDVEVGNPFVGAELSDYISEELARDELAGWYALAYLLEEHSDELAEEAADMTEEELAEYVTDIEERRAEHRL